MNKSERTKLVKDIKCRHTTYLNSLKNSYYQLTLGTRFNNLTRRLQSLCRKDFGSANSVKGIPRIARLMFGLHEDISRYGLPSYSFTIEKTLVNRYVKEYLINRKKSRYGGKCSLGETLFNCYLDVYVTLTVMKTPKEICFKPTFLVNPRSGSPLELDVLFEGFRLGFEFQGHSSHYTDPKTMEKDKIKLNECVKHQRVLIPVNISQLQNETLQRLIVNSLIDRLGLRDVLVMVKSNHFKKGSVSNNRLRQFSKLVQRIYLSKIIFGETLIWLDGEVRTYIKGQLLKSPVSASSPAPRFKSSGSDLDVDDVYKKLRYVKQLR